MEVPEPGRIWVFAHQSRSQPRLCSRGLVARRDWRKSWRREGRLSKRKLIGGSRRFRRQGDGWDRRFQCWIFKPQCSKHRTNSCRWTGEPCPRYAHPRRRLQRRRPSGATGGARTANHGVAGSQECKIFTHKQTIRVWKYWRCKVEAFSTTKGVSDFLAGDSGLRGWRRGGRPCDHKGGHVPAEPSPLICCRFSLFQILECDTCCESFRKLAVRASYMSDVLSRRVLVSTSKRGLSLQTFCCGAEVSKPPNSSIDLRGVDGRMGSRFSSWRCLSFTFGVKLYTLASCQHVVLGFYVRNLEGETLRWQSLATHAALCIDFPPATGWLSFFSNKGSCADGAVEVACICANEVLWASSRQHCITCDLGLLQLTGIVPLHWQIMLSAELHITNVSEDRNDDCFLHDCGSLNHASQYFHKEDDVTSCETKQFIRTFRNRFENGIYISMCSLCEILSALLMGVGESTAQFFLTFLLVFGGYCVKLLLYAIGLRGSKYNADNLLRVGRSSLDGIPLGLGAGTTISGDIFLGISVFSPRLEQEIASQTSGYKKATTYSVFHASLDLLHSACHTAATCCSWFREAGRSASSRFQSQSKGPVFQCIRGHWRTSTQDHSLHR